MEQPEAYCVQDIQVAATAKLEPRAAEYYNEGSMDLITVNANVAAYDRYRIIPRVLRDVADIDPTTTLWGVEVPFPFGFSPASIHCLAHPDGEVATSRAAAQTGIAMGLSLWATRSLEDVMDAGREIGAGNPYAFQTSSAIVREHNVDLMQRAANAGYKAILITVDAPVVGRRLNEYRNGRALPPGLRFPHISWEHKDFKNTSRDASITFDTFVPWLVEAVPEGMEIWLKGILASEDVLLAGCYPRISGVIVSNHGGRQLDSSPATLEALPDCVAAAKKVNASRSPGERLRIGIDGGIRRGSDIFKAVALGADMCFSGRVPIWGLAFDGQRGAARAVELLLEEFELCMQLAGCKTLADIGRDSLAIVEGGVPGIITRLSNS